MVDAARSTLLRLLKVPAHPPMPARTEGQVRIFRAAPNFYRYNLARWGLAQLGALTGLLAWLIFLRFAPGHLPDWTGAWERWVLYAEIAAWAGFLVQLPITFALLRLDYEMRWYVVTDRSLRIRSGLNRVREQTMTFANIQHMAVKQGPLQRLLGIADLEVRTAGGGSGGEGKGDKPGSESMHVGVFRGVDNAHAIRDAVRDRLRRYRDAGLGDPEDVGEDPVENVESGITASVAATRTTPAGGLLAAAGELLAETRALRHELEAPRS